MRASVPGRAAADATLVTTLQPAGRAFKVASVEYTPAADVTGAATNSLTVELRNRGPEAAPINVLIASLAFTSGTNAKRRQAKTITLQPVTDGAFVVEPDDRLEWSSIKVGAGLLDPGGALAVNETAI